MRRARCSLGTTFALLPGGGILVDTDPEDLAGILRARFGARVELGPVVATVRHAITHHRITFVVHGAEAIDRGRLQWFRLDGPTPWTTPARKVFRKTAGSEA